jgi:hypothetical protein
MRVACGGYVGLSPPLVDLQRGKFHVCRNTSKALQKDFRPSHVRRNNTKALQKVGNLFQRVGNFNFQLFGNL